MNASFYTSCTVLAIDCRLYQDNMGLTPVVDGYYSDYTDCFQVVSGVITAVSTCSPIYYAHPLSVGYENNFTVCSDNFQSITAFTSNELISAEDTLYTNQELTDIFVGGLLFYKNLLEGNYIRVRDAGTVALIGSCA